MSWSLFPNLRKRFVRKFRRQREVELNALVRTNYPAFCDLYRRATEQCTGRGITADVLVADLLDHEFSPLHQSGQACLPQRELQTMRKHAA